jgi:hypothetical protein
LAINPVFGVLAVLASMTALLGGVAKVSQAQEMQCHAFREFFVDLSDRDRAVRICSATSSKNAENS